MSELEKEEDRLIKLFLACENTKECERLIEDIAFLQCVMMARPSACRSGLEQRALQHLIVRE